MDRNYFPPCPVDGPIEPPAPFGHFTLLGAVPMKCSTCRNLFEGSCIRFFENVKHYLHLDHGLCGIDGPTDPVPVENLSGYDPTNLQHRSEEPTLNVPRKCAECRFLDYDSIHGYHCRKDADKWGAFHRGLDWGSWEPDYIHLSLPLPKITTRALSIYAKQNDEMAFIREHRRINPGLSLAEARSDFARFREVLGKL